MISRDDKNAENQSVSEADEAEAFKKVVERTASAEALLAVHNAQNPAGKMTSISLNGSVGRMEEPASAIANEIQGSEKKPLESLDYLSSAAMAAEGRFSSSNIAMPWTMLLYKITKQQSLCLY